MSKQSLRNRKHFSLCDSTFTLNTVFSIGASKNSKQCNAVNEFVPDKAGMLNLTARTKDWPSVSVVQSPFVTPRDMEADKENLPMNEALDSAFSRKTPVGGNKRQRLMEIDNSQQVCPFSLQSEELSNIKNIVEDLEEYCVSPFEELSACENAEEEFITPRESEDPPNSSFQTENTFLLDQNKKLMMENKQIREEYEEKIRKLEEQLALAEQELSACTNSINN
eukprot:TRINITY_DN4034_c0_g1_i5.p1 TRINITY_DN4034_c0_g1~~TRINITY_DN4034_c0_g1_i5.p1  ORF type:complete len:223 (-),score=60.31 TRINITY_DN4034_c0_g1_i5:189-857(-)